MSDGFDRELRDTFRRHDSDMVGHGLTPPSDLVRRVRRRQFATAGFVTVTLLTVAVIGVAGVRAIGSTEPQPAETPTAVPATASPTTEPPAAPEGTFADVRGWITYRSGSRIMAVNPAAPNDIVVLGSAPERSQLLGDSRPADPIGWSSDGRSLLLRSGFPQHEAGMLPVPELFVIDADGTMTTLVRAALQTRERGYATWGSFSPDGRQVVYAAGGIAGPYVIDADGGRARSLVDPCDRGCGEPFSEAAAWSPDGSRIAWLDFVEDSVTYGHHVTVLSFVNPDGSGLETEVANLPCCGWSWSLAWSHDGSKLAYWGGDLDLPGQIYVINADGTGLRQITQDGDNRWPAWSPDGSRIAFVHDGALYTMAADGTDMQPVGGVEPDGAIAWNPVAADG